MAGEGRFSRLAPQVQDKIFSLQHCSPDELDDRVLNLLSSVPTAEQVEALSKLDSALRTQRADVRNVSAFLAGVVKRMSGPGGGGGMGAHGGGSSGPPGRGPPGGGGMGGGSSGPYGHRSGPPPAGPQGGAAEGQLAPAAAQVLDRLYAEGRLRRGDLDSRSLGSLAALQPEAQAFVMHSFADRNLSTVRNMSGFFASHLANAERDIREGRVRLPPPQQQPAGARQPLPGGPAPSHGQAPPGAAPPQGGMQWGRPPQGPPGMQQPYDMLSGAYDPSEVAPPHLQQQQQQQQPFAGQPAPQQQLQQQVAPRQQQQQGLAGLPVDLQQLDGLLQSLAAQGAKPQALAAQQPQQLGLPLPSMPASGAAAPPAAGTAGTPTGAAAAAKHYGLEQLEWGVRVDEFHSLSPFAKYVHPAAALKLQQLWDAGNKLVSLMDDVSWEALAGLDAQHAVAVVGEVAEGVRTAPDDMTAANRAMVAAAARHPKRANAPTAASVGAVPAAQAAGPPAPMVHVQPAPQQAGFGSMPLQQAAPGMGGLGGLQQPLGGQPPLGLAPQQQLSPPLQQAPMQAQQPGFGVPPPGMAPALGAQPQLPPHLQQAPMQQPSMPGGPMPGGPMAGMLPPGGRGPLPPAPGSMLAPPAGGMQAVAQLPGPCGELPPVVQARIARLMETSGGMVRLEHFESRVFDMLLKMGPEAALRGLEDFARNDPRGMRSVTAYLIGCLKQHQDEARLGPGGPSVDPYGPPPTHSHSHGPGPERPRDQHRYRSGGSRWEDRGPPGGPPGGRGGGRGPYDDPRGGRGGGRGPYYGRGGGGGGGMERGRERAQGPRASPTY